MDNEDLEKTISVLVAGQIPVPETATEVADQTVKILRGSSLNILADLYLKNGIGAIAKGRLFLCDSNLLAPVVSALKLLPKDETFLSAYYGAFGEFGILSLQGTEIVGDTLTGQVFKFLGNPDDTLITQVNFATMIQNAVFDTQDAEQLIDLDGQNLFQSVRKKLGPLAYKFCYSTVHALDHPAAFSSETFEAKDIVDVILRRNEEDPFEIVVVPAA